MPALEETSVTLPRYVLQILLDNGPLCNVCTNWSPSWDGHNKNPPCLGTARELARKALEHDRV